MNINEQVDHILANLGVQMEHSDEPEISIFQSSRDHYGVFYRLDIIDSLPQLRIMLPVEHGDLKMEMYLVRLSAQAALYGPFARILAYHGSSPFERGREASLQHLLYAAAEMMKQLFWSGDLDSMAFPPEIEVQRLI